MRWRRGKLRKKRGYGAFLNGDSVAISDNFFQLRLLCLQYFLELVDFTLSHLIFSPSKTTRSDRFTKNDYEAAKICLYGRTAMLNGLPQTVSTFGTGDYTRELLPWDANPRFNTTHVAQLTYVGNLRYTTQRTPSQTA